MNLDTLKSELPEYAKDIKLNVSSVLRDDPASGLNQAQIMAIALASAYATEQSDVIQALTTEATNHLDDKTITAAKAAASIMAMNNIYYRFVHLAGNKQYQTMPAGLRMNIIANPGVDKVDFELMSLAVSAINGCGLCIDAHEKQLLKAGVKAEGIQHTVKIAAVVHALAQVRVIQ